MAGSGAHVKACISGLKGGPFPSSSWPSPSECRRGLFARESEDELDSLLLGVDDFLRELPLLWVEPLGAAESPHLTTYTEEEAGAWKHSG